MAISNDNTLIVSGSHNNTIIVWDREIGKKLKELIGIIENNNGDVMSVAIS